MGALYLFYVKYTEEQFAYTDNGIFSLYPLGVTDPSFRPFLMALDGGRSYLHVLEKNIFM